MNNALYTLTLDQLEAWADSRRTSVAIARALLARAATIEDAHAAWEDISDLEALQLVSEIFSSREDIEALYWAEATFTR